MNPLILVVGLPGTGKRTLSKHLEASFGFRRFNTDETRRLLGKKEYRREDTPEVIRHIKEQISQALLKKEGVIFHSAYKSLGGRQGIYNLAKQHGIPVILIECNAPERVVLERILNRPSKDALSTPPNEAKVYYRYQRMWEPTWQDFARNANPHVSHITVDTHTMTVTPKIIRPHSEKFVRKILTSLARHEPPVRKSPRYKE